MTGTPRRALLLLAVLSCAGSPSAAEDSLDWGELQPGPHAVGFRLLEEQDPTRVIGIPGPMSPTRPRPVRVYLWYPASRASDESPVEFGRYADLSDGDLWPGTAPGPAAECLSFSRQPLSRSLDGERFAELMAQPTRAIENAPALPGPLPLIVFGQGLYYESPVSNALLCEFLASYGFVVATSPLAGTESPLVQLNTIDLETAVRDLEFVVATARALPFVDRQTLGVVGFDMGAMAGLVLSMRRADVDAFASLDAALLYGHPAGIPESAADYAPERLQVPWLHVLQKRYGERPAEFRGESLFDSARGADRTLLLVDGVEHADFTSYALVRGRRPVAGYWGPPAEGAARRHAAVARFLVLFLRATLMHEGASREALAADPEALAPGLGFTVTHRSASVPPASEGDVLNALLAGRIDDARAAARRLRRASGSAPLLEARNLERLGTRLITAWQLHDEGMAVLELGAEFHPEEPEAWIGLAEGQILVGRKDAAASSLKKALALEPGNETAEAILEWLASGEPPAP